MEIFERRIAANRANAAKSKGSHAAAGQRKSRTRFADLFRDFNAEFQPATPNECALAEIMVVARWCLMRLRAELTSTSATAGIGANGRYLRIMGRYESRHDRQAHRAFARPTRFREEKRVLVERSHQPKENKEPIP